MTHDEAVNVLLGMGFEWAKVTGHVSTTPSRSVLSLDPGCCHGWVEIEGEEGLVGPVTVSVDGGFDLAFSSLVDLVAHLPPSEPPR